MVQRSEIIRAQLAATELEEQLEAEKARLADETRQRVEALMAQLAGASDVDTVAALVAELDEARKPVQVSDDLRSRVREARRAYRLLRKRNPAEESINGGAG